MIVIYKATNTLTRQMYIGVTERELAIRIKEHEHKKLIDDFHETLQQNPSIFKWEIIEEFDDVNLKYEKEKYWIKQYRDTGLLYNSSFGHQYSFCGRKVSENTKKKMSIAQIGHIGYMKGVKFSEEHKAKLSKPKSEEHKAKIAATRKGKPHPHKGYIHTEETKEIIRKKAIGRKHSEEVKNKISISSKGRKHTDETKQKISAAHKGKHKVWNDDTHTSYHME